MSGGSGLPGPKQTGTRPKSRGEAGLAGGDIGLAGIVREHRAVTESLALLRGQLASGGQQRARQQQQQQQQAATRPVSVLAARERTREVEALRARLRKLEEPSYGGEWAGVPGWGTGESPGGGASPAPALHHSPAPALLAESELERSLALLTAQYEKTPSQEEVSSAEKADSELGMPPAMAPLNNTEGVRLARELRDKRAQLEQLMKKNVFHTNVNEAPAGPAEVGVERGRSKDINRQQGSLADSPGQQLARLQDQVTRLKAELDRLSQPRREESPVHAPTPSAVSAQLAQLSNSANQLYSSVWGLQREVAGLGERLESLERAGTGQRETAEPDSGQTRQCDETWPAQPSNHNLNLWAGPEQDWPGFPGPAWPEPHQQHFSPFPSRHLWNSLQASPGFSNPLHPNLGIFGPNFHGVSETDSGVSSGALNNQVAPGLRANNYHDNFRSFSRQNRLSGAAAPTRQAGGRPAPSQEAANNLSVGAGAGSVPRQRRKYKINREQNRSGCGAGAESGLGAERRRGEGEAAIPAVETDSLTRNIYSQVGALIQQHDRAPELLARLLQDLTALGHRDRRTDNRNLEPADTADTSSFTSEGTRSSPAGRPSRSKVASKRLSFPAGPGERSSSDTAGGPGPDPGWAAPPHAVPKNQQRNLISRERDSRRLAAGAGAGAGWPGRPAALLPRNMQPEEDRPAEQDGFINIQLELGGPGEARLADMAEAELAEADQAGQVESLPGSEGGAGPELSSLHHHGHEAGAGVGFPVRDFELPALRPINQQGLDRVPIRLGASSSPAWPGPPLQLDRLDQLRHTEEDAVASIVEDVLASSPELANNRNADMPPSP